MLMNKVFTVISLLAALTVFYLQTGVRHKNEKKGYETVTYDLPTQAGDKKGK